MAMQILRKNPSLVFSASIVLLFLFAITIYTFIPLFSNKNSLEDGIKELKTKIEAYYSSGDIANESVYRTLIEKLNQVERAASDKNSEEVVNLLYGLLRYVCENEGKLISYKASEDLRSLINNLIFNVAKHL